LVLRGDGFEAMRDGSFAVAPAQQDDFAHLLRTLEEQRRLPVRIVHLWALETIPGAVHANAGDRALAFDSLVHLARALQESDVSHAIHLVVVSAGTASVRGEAVPHAERALALGPCRVIPRESPQVSARLVDFAQSE